MAYLIGVAVALLFVASAEGLEPYRFTGRVNSIAPNQGVMFVADADEERPEMLVPVVFRHAAVVRVSRHLVDPWRWQTRTTRLHRWPAGTFIVVTGHRDSSGLVWADRIEIPKPDAP